jgi:O-antigen ligase/polysaccharide polymerase Wzy-like membrane protein
VAASEAFSVRARGARLVEGVTPEALVLAVAIPVVFWHLRYQPKVHVHVGSTAVGIELSDVAVLAVVVAAIVGGMRLGFAPLRRGLPIWVAAGLLFVWIAISVASAAGSNGYPWQTHGVTAAKFFEYALLAPAVVLLLRRQADLTLLTGVVVAWSVVATLVGLIQFLGADIFVSGATGGRQLSFLGFHDFGALSAAALAVGLTAIALPTLGLDRTIGWVGVVSGALGVVLSAPITAVIGLGLAAVALLALALLRGEASLRRFAVIGAILAVTAAGAVAMRGDQLDEVLRFVGIEAKRDSGTNVESYAHRSVLAWIGWQIFVDNPVKGAGWEASGDPERYMPYVPEARREFPDEPDLAFPAPNRSYGVQNLYVQTLADLGVVGFVLLLSVFATVAWVALRSRNAFAAIGLAWAAVVAGVWAALGIVAGIPLDALTWIAFGLVAIAGTQDFPSPSGKVPLQ